MNKNLCLVIFFVISLGAGCKKDEAGGAPVAAEKEQMTCDIDGVAFRNDTGMQNLSFSYQSGSFAAYNIIGRNSNSQVRLYIQAEQNVTGSFTTPGQAKIIYEDSSGTYYPVQDSGLITITKNDTRAIAGKFNAIHTFDTHTRTFTNGEFYINK